MYNQSKHSTAIAAVLLLGIILTACQTSTQYSQQEHIYLTQTDELQLKREWDLLLRAGQADSIANALKASNKSQELILFYSVYGTYLRNAALLAQAVEAHTMGLDLAAEMHDTLALIEANNDIASDYRRLSILEKASQHHYKALELGQRFSDQSDFKIQKNYAKSMNGLGNIHASMNNANEAHRCFRTALRMEEQLNSLNGMAINFANIGQLYFSSAQYDSAQYFYKHALELNTRTSNTLGQAICSGHLAKLMRQQNQTNDALKAYKNALQIMEPLPDDWHRMGFIFAIAECYLAQNNTQAANEYIQQGLTIAKRTNSLSYISTAYNLLTSYYKKQGDYRQALFYYEQALAYNDSSQNENTQQTLQDLIITYERDKNLKQLSYEQEQTAIERSHKYQLMATGTVILILVIISAILFIRVLRSQLKLVNALMDIEKMRSTFLTNITHEFRTPLTLILGFTEQMQNTEISDEDKQKYLTVIDRQGHQLLDLVNSLLDVTRMVGKNDQVQWYNGNIIPYIQLCLENYTDYAVTKNIHLSFKPDTSNLNADFVPDYINKIIRNLVSNALKYTPEYGTIDVLLSSTDTQYTFQVIDTGKGIPEADMKYIFEIFYQGSNNEGHISSGIGLTYVQKLVKVMNGKISASNREDGKTGAIFTVTLPLLTDKNTLPWESEKPTSDNQPSAPLPLPTNLSSDPTFIITDEPDDDIDTTTILIVDDNADIAQYIATIVQKDYNVIMAKNGQEGIEKAIQYMPSIILTDLMMPQMNGYELCKAVRSKEEINHIPIIVITSKSEESARLQALEYGADAVLTKPFNAQELRFLISNILSQRQLSRSRYKQAIEQGDTEPTSDMHPLDKAFVDKVIDIINEHMADANFSIDLIAEQLKISRSALVKKVKSLTGQSITILIQTLKMDKAKDLLLNTNLPVIEVGNQCGFYDPAYFSRVFKNVHGETPLNYRNRNPHPLS